MALPLPPRILRWFFFLPWIPVMHCSSHQNTETVFLSPVDPGSCILMILIPFLYPMPLEQLLFEQPRAVLDRAPFL